MSNFQQELREVAEDWANFQSQHSGRLEELEPDEYNRIFNQRFDQFIEAITKLIEEQVIGEDLKRKGLDEVVERVPLTINKFKAEQRAIVRGKE